MITTRSLRSPLSNDQLAKIAPSIFAEAPHASRSARYAHIPTVRILDALRDHGFAPMMALQSRVRDNSTGRQDYTKHMIRFRHQDASTLSVGDTFPEVVLVNSHDGTSAYQLNAGLFRLVCGNGMVVSAGDLGAIRVQHTGNVVAQVIEASFRVLDDSTKALTHVRNWSQLQLNSVEQNALAVAAHHLRFADSAGHVDTPIQPAQLLHARRSADHGDDLWRTFNRVQENVVWGGLQAQAQLPAGGTRRVSTREVKGIDGNLNLNKALWKLAEALAAGKAAA